MVTLVFSDLHLRHRQLDQILSWEKFDRVVLLGDIFDQHGDTVEQSVDAARWLQERLSDPRFVCLLGNHDQAYRWPGNHFAYASGFSWGKNKAIREVLTEADFAKMRPCHVEQDILLTHAGLDRSWLEWMQQEDELMEPTAAAIAAKIDCLWPHICALFKGGHYHCLLGVGLERGGWQRVGGITWCDSNYHRPIKGLKQIFGHTIQDANKGPMLRFPGAEGVPQGRYLTKGVKPEWLAGGWSLCLDTNSRHYAVLEPGKMTVKSVLWKRPKGQEMFHVEQGETICEVAL